MDQYYGSATKPIDEGMYPDETGGNFDYEDEEIGASGEALMRIDSSSGGAFMSHHHPHHHPHHHHSSALMMAERIVHSDFFNDFGDLFDTDNFVINGAPTTTATATTTTAAVPMPPPSSAVSG